MLVIEGFAGKSLEVAKYIEKLGDDVLIVTHDKLAINSMRAGKQVYFMESSDVEDIKKALKLHPKFEHVVFYQNVSRKDIEIYKEIEEFYGLKAVLTVQTPNNENYSENPRKVTTYNV